MMTMATAASSATTTNLNLDGPKVIMYDSIDVIQAIIVQ